MPRAAAGKPGTSKRATKRPAAKPSRKLPAALVRNASAKAEQKLLALRAEALQDIEEVLRKARQIADLFFDVGLILVRLKRPGVAAAVGCTGFEQLCQEKLGFSAEKANELITIATRAKRSQALVLGQDRTAALIALADASPEADLQRLLDGEKTKLPGGKVVDPERDRVSELEALAKELRARRVGGGRPKGRTTTASERAEAARLQASARAHGLTAAKISALATLPGQAANVRIEGVPLASVGVLAEILSAKPRRKNHAGA